MINVGEVWHWHQLKELHYNQSILCVMDKVSFCGKLSNYDDKKKCFTTHIKDKNTTSG
jgi:hypothetical protein